MTARDEALRDVRRRLTPDRLMTAFSLQSGAKRQPSGWLVRCPAHDDSTASCSLTIGDDGTTRVRCFGCDLAGDALALVAAKLGLDAQTDFARVLDEAGRACGVDVPPIGGTSRPLAAPAPARPAVPSSAHALAPLDASLRSRGLLEQAVADGWHHDAGTLAIPWRNRAGACTTTQWRYVGPDGDTTAAPPPGVPRYRFPPQGGASAPYGVERAEVSDRAAELWIVEGAVDVLAVRALAALYAPSRRLAALGLPGVAAWSRLRDAVLSLARDRIVVVATDADEAGDKSAIQIAEDVKSVAALVRRERPAGKDWADMLSALKNGGNR